MKKPNSDKTTVLHHAITTGYIDCIKFSWLEGYRARVTNLEAAGVKFEKIPVVSKNRFGHAKRIIRRKLVNKPFAIKLYNKLTA
jgi:hypothetical protein